MHASDIVLILPVYDFLVELMGSSDKCQWENGYLKDVGENGVSVNKSKLIKAAP